MRYNYLKIAEIIKEKRLESGMSQRQLGEIAGISHTEIGTIEKGMKLNYSLLILIKLCEVLDIDFVELLKTAGYIENNTTKKYKVIAQNKNEETYLVRAKNYQDACKNVYEFIKKNNIFGNKNIGRIRFNVSETDEDISDELDINELFKEDDEEEMTDDEFFNARFRIVRNQ